MGKDILQKLKISLQQSHICPQVNTFAPLHETEKNFIKLIFKKKTKNHIAKSISKQNHTPNQQNGRRVPLHFLEKKRIQFGKTNSGQTIKLT